MMSRDGYNIELILNVCSIFVYCLLLGIQADNARMMLAGGDSYEDFVNKSELNEVARKIGRFIRFLKKHL